MKSTGTVYILRLCLAVYVSICLNNLLLQFLPQDQTIVLNGHIVPQTPVIISPAFNFLFSKEKKLGCQYTRKQNWRRLWTRWCWYNNSVAFSTQKYFQDCRAINFTYPVRVACKVNRTEIGAGVIKNETQKIKSDQDRKCCSPSFMDFQQSLTGRTSNLW